MTYGKLLNNYQKTCINTSSDLELVILCYDKIVQFLTQAKQYYENGEYEKKAESTSKALDLIGELQSCLDFEKGGQVAQNLNALYSYLTRRLLEGDIARQVVIYDEVIQLTNDLKEAWEQIACRTGADSENSAHQSNIKMGDNQIAA